MRDPRPIAGADVLDLGAIRSRDGWFLPRLRRPAPEEQAFVPEKDGSDATWRFCSTFRESPPTLRDAVLEIIRGARKKVFVTSFILGDDMLTEALVATANRLRGGVYVISELSERSLRRGLAELADKEERGKETGPKVAAEKKRFMSLTRQGVAVRGHENCHAKFVVVDDAVAWVGSANLETRAFTQVGEAGVVTTDHAEVTRLARLFARMWLAGCTYELPGSATDDYKVDERDPTPVAFEVAQAPVEDRASLMWTDDTSDTLLRHIHDVISKARRRLILASWSLTGMTERPDLLLAPVAEAVARSVKVELFVRAMNHRDRHRRDAGRLDEMGVHVVADNLNHAKAALADDRHGALFSANFDAAHGLDAGSGIEIGARLDGTPALPALRRYLHHAIEQAPYEYVPVPTARQLDESLHTGWRTPWPLADDIPVRATSADWRRLASEARDEPVLWMRHDGSSVDLLAGRSRFRLSASGSGLHDLRAATDTGEPVARVLTKWWNDRDRDRSNKPAAGYCPARLHRQDSTPR
jgi:phosphatidylserine/phosphatidylglycerophosphate/cardiolipin synthase-like enzyme